MFYLFFHVEILYFIFSFLTYEKADFLYILMYAILFCSCKFKFNDYHIGIWDWEKFSNFKIFIDSFEGKKDVLIAC